MMDALRADVPLVVVTGPTASGKSALAVKIARSVGGEIVNADSVQLYRDFNIGAAKPSEADLQTVDHHLISVLDPAQEFDAETFRLSADEAIVGIAGRGKLPIVVGGPGLYLRSLLMGLVRTEPIAESARSQLAEREAEVLEKNQDERHLGSELHRWLAEHDPEHAARLHPADLSRLRRALLVVLSSGRKLSSAQEQHAHGAPRYRAFVIALVPDRRALYRTIDARVDAMLRDGLLAEVEQLLGRYPASCRAFGSIGYRHAVEHLEGRVDYVEMVRKLKRDTRRFAKRQLSWLSTQPRLLGWEEEKLDCPETSSRGRSKENPDILSDIIGDYRRSFAAWPHSGIAFMRVEIVDIEIAASD